MALAHSQTFHRGFQSESELGLARVLEWELGLQWEVALQWEWEVELE